jgi:hypothetical protein
MPWARKSPSARVHPISVLFWTAVCPDSGFPWPYAVRAGVRRDGPPVCFSWQRLLGSRRSEPERARAANVALKSNILARGSKTQKPDRACCSHMDIYDIAIVVLMFVNAIIVIYIIATIRS